VPGFAELCQPVVCVLPDPICPDCRAYRVLHDGILHCEECHREDKVPSRPAGPAPVELLPASASTHVDGQAMRPTACRCGGEMEDRWGTFVCPDCGERIESKTQQKAKPAAAVNQPSKPASLTYEQRHCLGKDCQSRLPVRDIRGNKLVCPECNDAIDIPAGAFGPPSFVPPGPVPAPRAMKKGRR
jgi:uncharacterized protein YlaI